MATGRRLMRVCLAARPVPVPVPVPLPRPRLVSTRTRCLPLSHHFSTSQVRKNQSQSNKEKAPSFSTPQAPGSPSEEIPPPSYQPTSNPSDTLRRSLQNARARVRSTLPALTPHENIYNLPNALTLSRLFAAPLTAYLILHDHPRLALSLFAYAGITDLIDGWLARKYNLQTVAGSVIDPMADKALMILLTVTLAVKGAIPAYLATLILGRDASLALAAIYYRYASLPAPKTFLRYWDFSLPSAEVHPTTVSKYNTLLQLLLIGWALALPVVYLTEDAAGKGDDEEKTLHRRLDQAMVWFQYVVAGTTAWSGMSYAFLPRAVTILGKDEVLKVKQGRRGRMIIGVTFGAVVLGAVGLIVRGEGGEDEDQGAER